MRIAVLVKQVPRLADLALGEDGRLRRDGADPELNPYCRRAVAQAVLLTRGHGGSATAVTLGPPSAEDALREAVAWGCDDGVLVSDPALSGSDTLATARALAAVLRILGPFDLVLCGRNSVDADTGQVGPGLAELLELPFAGPARRLTVDGHTLALLLERDDGTEEASVALPALVACAERLCDPAKVDPAGRAAVEAGRIRHLDATALGAGPWGITGSPTRVGRVRRAALARAGRILDGPVDEQAEAAVAELERRGALASQPAPPAVPPRPPRQPGLDGPAVVVVAEPGADALTTELTGAAAQLADALAGHVVVVGAGSDARGADLVLAGRLSEVAEDAAAVVAGVLSGPPVAVAGLLPGTQWGREVGGRVAARLGCGLVGDAVELAVENGRLVAWKPAFGGALLAAVHWEGDPQLATVRPGVLPLAVPVAGAPHLRPLPGAPVRGRVRLGRRQRDDDVEALVRAEVLVGVGGGVDPAEYPLLEPLCRRLGAELAASRRVTDRGWLPRSRQVGITGRAVAPRLYIALGVKGTFNHTVGWRQAGTVVAVNSDAAAPVFAAADIGITAPWQDAVAALLAALEGRSAAAARR